MKILIRQLDQYDLFHQNLNDALMPHVDSPIAPIGVGCLSLSVRKKIKVTKCMQLICRNCLRVSSHACPTKSKNEKKNKQKILSPCASASIECAIDRIMNQRMYDA